MLRRRRRVTMPHHASLSIKAGLMRRRFHSSRNIESGQPVSELVEREIAEPLAAVAQETQEAGIDKVSQKEAVARAYFRSDRIGGVPGVGANGERITAVRHE